MIWGGAPAKAGEKKLNGYSPGVKKLNSHQPVGQEKKTQHEFAAWGPPPQIINGLPLMAVDNLVLYWRLTNCLLPDVCKQ